MSQKLLTVPFENNDLKTKDLSYGEPQNFPIDAFPENLRNVVTEMAKLYQTPVCLSAMSSLAILSGSIGRSAYVTGAFKDKATYLNLFVVPVAKKSVGKGNIGEQLCHPINERSLQYAQMHARKQSGLRHDKAILENKKPKGKNKNEITEAELLSIYEKIDQIEAELDIDKTLTASNTTSEALAKLLADNAGEMFIFDSDGGETLAVALGAYRKGDSADMDIYLKGYSGDMIKYNRLGRSKVQVMDPVLSLLIFIQPYVLNKLTSHQEVIARGFTARMLIFDTQAKREYENRTNEEFTCKESWRCMIEDILNARLDHKTQTDIKCSDEAREVFYDFSDETVDLENNDFPDLEGEAGRWRQNAIKIAGIFALIDCSKVVTKAHAIAAVKVVKWCGYNYLNILKAGRIERNADKLKRLRDIISKEGPLYLGELNTRHNITREDINILMSVYPETVCLKKGDTGSRGRPGELVYIIQ